MMTTTGHDNLDQYYAYVLSAGKLRTPAHARRWSDAILKTLGFHLNRKTKRALAKALPKELADALQEVFWLLHFRDPELTLQTFQEQVARRSGNSNAEFAYHPTLAVFAAVKQFTDSDLDRQVAEALSPEVSELWRQAKPEAVTG
jgi:uncharacterized protein (DUF2267 family)